MPNEDLDGTTAGVTGAATPKNNKMLYILGGSVLGLAALGGLGFFIMNQNSKPAPSDDTPPPAPVSQSAAQGTPEDGGPKPNPIGAPGKQSLKGPNAAGASKVNGLALPIEDSWTRLAKKMAMKDKMSPAPGAPATGDPMSAPGMDPAGVAGGAGGGASAGKKPEKEIKLVLASTGGKYRSDPFVSFYKLVTPQIPATQFSVSDRLASPAKLPPPPKDLRPPDELYGPLPIVERRVAGILYNGGISAILEVGAFPNSESFVVHPGDKVPSGTPGIEDMTVESINLTELVLRAVDGRTAKVKISGLRPDQISAILSQVGSGNAGAGAGAGAPAGVGAPTGAGKGGGGGTSMGAN
jgi:hypothetical protein